VIEVLIVCACFGGHR